MPDVAFLKDMLAAAGNATNSSPRICNPERHCPKITPEMKNTNPRWSPICAHSDTKLTMCINGAALCVYTK